MVSQCLAEHGASTSCPAIHLIQAYHGDVSEILPQTPPVFAFCPLETRYINNKYRLLDARHCRRLGAANYDHWAKSAPRPVFVNEVLLAHSLLTPLHTVYGSLHAPESSSYGRGRMVHKASNTRPFREKLS